MTCQPCFDGRHIRCEERRGNGCGCSVCKRKTQKKRDAAEKAELLGAVPAESEGHSEEAQKHYDKAGQAVEKVKKPRKPRAPRPYIPSDKTVKLPDGRWRKKFTEKDIKALAMLKPCGECGRGFSYAEVAKALDYPNRYAIQTLTRRYADAEAGGFLEHVLP